MQRSSAIGDADTGTQQQRPAGAEANTAAEKMPVARAEVQCTTANTVTTYANFCRVTGTPEELILDFALNQQPMAVPTEPIEIGNRVVMNYYTAKRMMAALHMSLARFEANFGVLETDVQKRVVTKTNS